MINFAATKCCLQLFMIVTWSNLYCHVLKQTTRDKNVNSSHYKGSLRSTCWRRAPVPSIHFIYYFISLLTWLKNVFDYRRNLFHRNNCTWTVNDMESYWVRSVGEDKIVITRSFVYCLRRRRRTPNAHKIDDSKGWANISRERFWQNCLFVRAVRNSLGSSSSRWWTAPRVSNAVGAICM